VGALVAVLVFAWVDPSSGGGPAAAPTSAPTSTTSAVPNAATVYRKIQPSLVLIETGTDPTSNLATLGSGVIINAQGNILTAEHVVDGASTIFVTFGDGTQTTATVVSSSHDDDTAVLAPDKTPSVIVPAVLGGGVHVGDPTFSVGNPLGLTDSISQGVISGLDRSLTREDGTGEIKGLIQFDAAVNPGSSGGPLLDKQGQVVGIVTALANPTNERFFVGIGFAVPIASAGGGAHVPPG